MKMKRFSHVKFAFITLRTIQFVMILFVITSCGGSISHKLSKDYPPKDLRSVVVLPISGYAEPKAKEVFRTFIKTALSDKNFAVLPDSAAEAVYLKLGKVSFYSLKPKDMARAIGADMVMFCKVYKMEVTDGAGYKALDISIGYKLFDKNGELLWESDHEIGDSGFGFDPKLNELAVIETYEPKAQRLVDASFTTLPPLPDNTVDRSGHYGWLP